MIWFHQYEVESSGCSWFTIRHHIFFCECITYSLRTESLFSTSRQDECRTEHRCGRCETAASELRFYGWQQWLTAPCWVTLFHHYRMLDGARYSYKERKRGPLLQSVSCFYFQACGFIQQIPPEESFSIMGMCASFVCWWERVGWGQGWGGTQRWVQGQNVF